MIFNKFIFIFTIFFLVPTNLFAINLATINISYILEKSVSYNIFLEELSKKKSELQNSLNSKENEVEKLNKEINDSKLILNEDELNILITNYNNKLKILDQEVKSINLFFSENIEINKNKIIKQIIGYIENISKDLNLDIILTEEQYFMSSIKIDISDKVIDLINKNLITLKIINEQQIFE